MRRHNMAATFPGVIATLNSKLKELVGNIQRRTAAQLASDVGNARTIIGTLVVEVQTKDAALSNRRTRRENELNSLMGATPANYKAAAIHTRRKRELNDEIDAIDATRATYRNFALTLSQLDNLANDINRHILGDATATPPILPIWEDPSIVKFRQRLDSQSGTMIPRPLGGNSLIARITGGGTTSPEDIGNTLTDEYTALIDHLHRVVEGITIEIENIKAQVQHIQDEVRHRS